MVENRGTFVYDFLVKRTERINYYDVEKLLWKHKHFNKRFLSAIKCFDENPRINFT